MSFDAPHIGYVLVSYALSATVVVGLAAMYVIRSRRVEKRLKQLQSSGAARRKPAKGSAK